MNRFFVGQRVRLIECTSWPEASGAEGVITAIVNTRYSAAAGGYEEGTFYRLGLAVSLSPVMRPDGSLGTCVAASASQIEPILPPKQQEVVNWEECEFTREGKWKVPVEVRA